MEPTNDQLYSVPGKPLPPFTAPLALLGLFFLSALGTAFYLSSASAPAAHVAAAAAAPEALDDLALEAQGVYVMDMTDGRVLYERNADSQLPLASLTKVALALAASEVLPPEYVVRIPYDTAPRGSAERLGRGEEWKVKDIIDFTLVSSSNGGADILAEAANDALRAKYPEAPQGQATLWRMNGIARELGLTSMYFLNDNGLDISATQAGAYGSARDVAALLSYAASKKRDVFAGTAQDGILLSSENGDRTSALNTNKALGSIPGLIMGKTGFTDLAGGNLGIVFDAGLGHPIVAVVMHSSQEGRFEDMRRVVEAVLGSVSERK